MGGRLDYEVALLVGSNQDSYHQGALRRERDTGRRVELHTDLGEDILPRVAAGKVLDKVRLVVEVVGRPVQVAVGKVQLPEVVDRPVQVVLGKVQLPEAVDRPVQVVLGSTVLMVADRRVVVQGGTEDCNMVDKVLQEV